MALILDNARYLISKRKAKKLRITPKFDSRKNTGKLKIEKRSVEKNIKER
jgi:hypothetical protein